MLFASDDDEFFVAANIDEAKALIREHEFATCTQYAAWKSKKNFGVDGMGLTYNVFKLCL